MIRRIALPAVAAIAMMACANQAKTAEATAAEIPALECSDGAVLKGARPPEGEIEWCEKTGIPHGAWRTFTDKGAIASEGAYDDGHRIGPFVVWKDGEKAASIDTVTGPGVLTIHNAPKEAKSDSDPTLPVVEGRTFGPCPEGTESHRVPTMVAKAGVKGGVPAGVRVSCSLPLKDGEKEPTRHGVTSTFYKNGAMESRVAWVQGMRQGLFTLWHVNGKKWIEGEYHLDRPHGPWFVWNEDGSPYIARDGESVPLLPPEVRMAGGTRPPN